MTDDSRSALRTLAKGGGVIFAGRILEQGISFLAKILIAQLLGKVDYGAVAIGVTTLSFVSAITVLGMKQGIGRFLPRSDEEDHKRGVIRSAFEISVPISVVAGVAVFVSADYVARHLIDDASVAPILKVAAVGIPFAAVYYLSLGGIQGAKKSLPKVAIENITLPVTRLLVVVVAIGLGYGAVGVTAAYAIAFVVSSLLGLFYLSRHTELFSSGPRLPMHRELLGFSAPLVVVGIMGKVLADIDTFLLGYYTTTGDVGVYNVVYPVALLLLTILMSFGFLFLPVLSEFHANDNYEDMRRFYMVLTKWVFLTTLPLYLAMAVFPELVIGLTFGAEYTEGGLALSILVSGFFLHAFIGPNDKTLTTIGQTKFVMYVTVVTALLNLGLNVLLIPSYSYVGAAAATTISYVSMNAMYSVQLYRETGIHPFSSALVRPGIAAFVLFGIVYGTLTTLLPTTIPVVLGIFTIFGIGYVGVIIRFGGIEREELQLLEDVEHKFGVDLEPMKDAARRIM